jgi:hypothetical protein
LFDPAEDTYGPVNSLSPVYEASFESIAPGVTRIAQEQKAPGESILDTFTRLLPQLAATYQQKQLLDVQVERARQGLPPLNTNQYAAGLNVGVSQDTQKMLMYGAIGLGALFVFSTLMKRG